MSATAAGSEGKWKIRRLAATRGEPAIPARVAFAGKIDGGASGDLRVVADNESEPLETLRPTIADQHRVAFGDGGVGGQLKFSEPI